MKRRTRTPRCIVTGVALGVSRYRVTFVDCAALAGLPAVRELEAHFGKRGLDRALRMIGRAMEAPKKRRVRRGKKGNA